MKQITNKEYERLMRLDKASRDGLSLQPDTLRMICEAYDNNPEKIGRHLLEALAKIKAEHPEMFQVLSEDE